MSTGTLTEHEAAKAVMVSLQRRIAEVMQERDEAYQELLYIMELYDTEVWNCERCGHAEPTKDMNGAYFLRDWLIAKGLMKSEPDVTTDPDKGPAIG